MPQQLGERLDVALDEQDAVLVVDRGVNERDATVDALRVEAARAGRDRVWAFARRGATRRPALAATLSALQART